MERIYEPTKRGKKAYRRSALSGEEMQVLDYLVSNKSANTSQLEANGCPSWLVRSMVRRKLVKELGE